jgi:hypothetical protein
VCELLALNANTPTDMGFSFRGLSRRGGASGEHADGWGLACFPPDGHLDRPGLTLLREEAPAAFSALADQLAERSPKALVSIAHIRKATRGVVALENCHPFSRSWAEQTWVFAHNGDLQGAIPLGDRYRPFGSTDSEAAFCWLLEELDRAGVDPAGFRCSVSAAAPLRCGPGGAGHVQCPDQQRPVAVRHRHQPAALAHPQGPLLQGHAGGSAAAGGFLGAHHVQRCGDHPQHRAAHHR